MTRNTPEGQSLTRLEEDVLDVFHRTLPLWNRPRPVAIFATLAAFDLLNAPTALFLPGVAANPGSIQQLKWLHDSLIVALRFFWQDEHFHTIDPVVSADITTEAMKFLVHAKNYALLSDFHTGFNRGLYRIEVSETESRVRFLPSERDGSSPDPAGLLDTFPGYWQHMSKVMQKGKVQGQNFVDACRRVPNHFEDGRVVIDDASRLGCREIEEFTQLLLPPENRHLSDSADLLGFSAGDFHCFWRAIFKWSVTAFGAYCDAWFSGGEQYSHLPTQFVAREKLVEEISLLSGLARDKVALCLERLTFGNGCEKSRMCSFSHFFRQVTASRGVLT